jgi:hypothetical protein
MPREELIRLLEALDDEARSRWESYLEQVDAEVQEKGPQAARDHLDAAFKHLLAVAWAVHLCYAEGESQEVMSPIGEAASTLEQARAALDQVTKKPEWSQ